MPWIAKAEVRRRLPDTVEIRLSERVPVAYWEDGGLVDSEGNVFAGRLDEEVVLPQFKGQDGAGKVMVERFSMFKRELAKEKLSVATLAYTPRSAWEIVLSNGITVKLGRDKVVERLKRFVRVWPTLLKPQADGLHYVDMRYKDGFAVRLKEQQTDNQGGLERPSENN